MIAGLSPLICLEITAPCKWSSPLHPGWNIAVDIALVTSRVAWFRLCNPTAVVSRTLFSFFNVLPESGTFCTKIPCPDSCFYKKQSFTSTKLSSYTGVWLEVFMVLIYVISIYQTGASCFILFCFLSWLLLCSAVNLTLSLAPSVYTWPCSTVARMLSS